MKIRYFYFKFGDIEVFQAGNMKKDPIPRNVNLLKGQRFELYCSGMPELRHSTIFLNGSDQEYNFQFLLNYKQQHSPNLAKMVELIKQVEIKDV